MKKKEKENRLEIQIYDSLDMLLPGQVLLLTICSLATVFVRLSKVNRAEETVGDRMRTKS